MKIPTWIYPIIGLVILYGGVGLAQNTGYWQVTRQTEIKQSAEGLANPDDIKGWMEIGYVADVFGVPFAELARGMNLPPEVTPQTPTKDIEKMLPGFSTDALRIFIKDYQAKSAGTTPPAGVTPATAPATQPKPSPASGAAPSPQPKSSPAPTMASGDKPAFTPTTGVSGAPVVVPTITGSSTLQQVVTSSGVPFEYLQQQLKLPANIDRNAPLKDVAEVNGFTIPQLREVVSGYKR
jgi:hypothetical protein